MSGEALAESRGENEIPMDRQGLEERDEKHSYRLLIHRNLSLRASSGASSSLPLPQPHPSDVAIMRSFSSQEKRDFISCWAEGEGRGSLEEFLIFMKITKEEDEGDCWREWMNALHGSKNTLPADHTSSPLLTPSPSLSHQSLHEDGSHKGDEVRNEREWKGNGEVIVPMRRESVADIKRRFNSRSKLEIEIDYQRIIRRNFSQQGVNNSQHSQDCEAVKQMNSIEKIEFLSTWYDIRRERKEEEGEEFVSHETPEIFLSSFGIRKETCQSAEEWREWVIALSKSAASERSSQRRKSSSSKKINSHLESERNSISVENEAAASGERISDFINPQLDVPTPEAVADPVDGESSPSLEGNSTPEDVISSSPPRSPVVISAPQEEDPDSSTPKHSETSTQATQSPPNSPPRTLSTSRVDDFNSQVISSTVSHPSVEYKKALSAASVVFAQAPDEDRESMWSNVDLSFSEVSRTSAQNPYIKPEHPPPVSSPLHSNCQHISIDDTKDNSTPEKSSCCLIL